MGDHRWQLKITQIDCQLRGLAQHLANKASGLSGSPLLNSKRFNSFQKYSTTFASGFNTMTNTASMLAYEMLRTQITPRAPNGCLQYFTSPSGIIESFNFGQYLNQMDYSICIQRHQETCRIVFTSSDYDWSINGVGVSSATSGVGDQDCARDYLMIPGASRNGDGFTYDRYCGGRLNYYRGQTLSSPVVIKTNGPIVLRFHSDATYESVNSGGFRLQYEQSNQDCMYHSAEEAGSLTSSQLIMSTFGDSQPLPSSLQVSHNEINPTSVTNDKNHLALLYSGLGMGSSSINEATVDNNGNNTLALVGNLSGNLSSPLITPDLFPNGSETQLATTVQKHKDSYNSGPDDKVRGENSQTSSTSQSVDYDNDGNVGIVANSESLPINSFNDNYDNYHSRYFHPLVVATSRAKIT